MDARGGIDVAALMQQPLPVLPEGLSEVEEDILLGEIAEYCLAHPLPGASIPLDDLP